MRPILLQGHERALTQIKYSAKGDLLFTASKDQAVCVWYSSNGERLGTYDGHKGSVWTVDADSETRFLVTGGADNDLKLWSIQTGKCLFTWSFLTAIKRVQWSDDDSHIFAVTEQRMGYAGAIRVLKIDRSGDGTVQSEEPVSFFSPTGSKVTVAAWAPMGKKILTGHESGKVSLFDAENGEELIRNDKAHMEIVTDLQMSEDGTYFITSSRDKTAKIHDTNTLAVIKTYTTETPLNSAAIITLKPYVILGGGQDAQSVTTTSARKGKFEARFWHKILEEEVGRVKGHFGPLNTIAVHPSGKAFASGSEDGFVRVNWFDDSYLQTNLLPGADYEIMDYSKEASTSKAVEA